ncbi:MAG: hypothetical protein KatS3mg053_0505 [Candidatus Roseilinea sp.]|nr:MAG: hypothetical protein KatS3mg053_0505 [Candidatus Roseilinea sp.]
MNDFMLARNLRLALLSALAGLLAVAVVLTPAVVHAETKSLVWTRLDTEIEVQPNGDLKITETNVIDFTSGTFSWGFRDIELSRVTDVRDIVVTESGQPLETEIVYTDDNKLRIKYYFLRPARDEQRTFVLNYTVVGATRYYDAGDQVFWAAVYPERNGFAVQNARAVVRLPAGATATNAEVYGVRADVKGLGESVVVAEALQPIPSGDQMEIRVQFPHGIITGGPPPWQRAYDERRRFEETEKPRYDFFTLLAALLIFFGGPALAAVLYYTRGRDPNVGLIAQYLTEPPDVPPGVAGTLIDETADMQDVVATLVDLARRGVLTMKEKPVEALGGALTVTDWTFAPGENFGKVGLRPFEQKLVDALQLNQGERVLSSFRNNFYARLPELQNALYDELVRAGYYNHAPNATRSTYQSLAMIIGVIAALAFCASIALLSELTDYAICLPIALGVTAAAFFLIARNMPARTRKGADMRMRAEAFKRYLQNIEKYTDVKESKDLFEKYLPYAVAFGLEHSWTKKFAAVDAPMPPWYVPVWPRPYYDPYYGGRRGPVVMAGAPGSGEVLGRLEPRGDISGQARADGGIEGMEKSMGRGISSIEGGLASMFESMSTTFGSRPVSSPSRGGWSSGRSGGGWSGGGGGGGGSSGGGGGGFG